MKLLFFLFFLMYFISLVGAVSFSPSSLTFNLKPGEENCKTINIKSESDTVAVSDKWAENKDVEWKVNSFDKDANYHNILINYPEKVLGKDNFEVCISGSSDGEFHGVLLMQEEQQGNSIVQVGVWLKVLVENKKSGTNSGSSGSSSSSSGSGALSGGSATGSFVLTGSDEDNKNKNIEDVSLDSSTENGDSNRNSITGRVIDNLGKLNSRFLIFFTIAILGFVIGYFIHKKNKEERRWKEFGY